MLISPADVELSAEDVDILEKASSAAYPVPKRAVLPDWGLDIYEDKKQAKL